MFGIYMKLFRIERDMAQKELAKELGIPGSDADICRLERGTKRTLNALRARFIVYCTTARNWGLRKANAKDLLIHVSDLNESERNYLVSIIIS
jgi:transcriptional regulator with XRE-family HTH domain